MVYNKHSKSKKMSYTKNKGWTHVLSKGKPFLSLIRHTPCYSRRIWYISASDNTSACGLFVSVMTRFIRYVHHWNFQFINNVIIKPNVLLPQVYVKCTWVWLWCCAIWFSCSYKPLNYLVFLLLETFKLFGFLAPRDL